MSEPETTCMAVFEFCPECGAGIVSATKEAMEVIVNHRFPVVECATCKKREAERMRTKGTPAATSDVGSDGG